MTKKKNESNYKSFKMIPLIINADDQVNCIRMSFKDFKFIKTVSNLIFFNLRNTSLTNRIIFIVYLNVINFCEFCKILHNYELLLKGNFNLIKNWQIECIPVFLFWFHFDYQRATCATFSISFCFHDQKFQFPNFFMNLFLYSA